MTKYQPEPGERAIFHGSATDGIEVLVADYRGHFQQMGDYRPGIPALVWRPYADHKAGECRPLDADTQAWVWETLVEAKRRHEAGEPLAPLATHRLVKNTGNTGMPGRRPCSWRTGTTTRTGSPPAGSPVRTWTCDRG